MITNLSPPLYLCLILLVALPARAQPQPSDVFREYTWLPTMSHEDGQFLRVGGRLDYQIYPDYFPADGHQDGHIPIQEALDLELAIRAEVVLEMVQSHDDTKGLALQMNNRDWIPVPPLAGIPQPQSAYMLHAYPVVPVPLDHLHGGFGNTFKLKVDTTQRWNWPQHLFYGVILRIYYEPGKAPRAARVVGITPGAALTETQPLWLDAPDPATIAQVEYIGLYDDVNWEGDGLYRQWHYHYHQGQLRNHIGTATAPPFRVDWSTTWLPDQYQDIQVAARVMDTEGLITMTSALDGLRLERDYAVELSRPYRQPTNWATREDSLTAYFAIHGNPQQVEALHLAWRSWSPCYARGVFINGVKVWDRQDLCYDYAEHRVEVDGPTYLQHGENTISTGKTPLYDGQMVHGMEVQWPGIMVKVKYRARPEAGVRIEDGVYVGRPHFIIHTPAATYYYDKAGGGLSRMIDPEDRDWISFWDTPWGEYPAGAASAFRGIPNLVYQSDDGGAGHPGHKQCVSERVGETTIRSTSKSGKWQWEWSFYPEYARLEVQRVDTSHAYWFLYEGTPGGTYAPAHQYFGTNAGGPRYEQPDYYNGSKLFDHWHWAYFGHNDVNRVLFIAQQNPDTHSDTFSYLGNSEAGLASNDGMTVFGFGRADPAVPLLKEPQTFFLGFWEKAIVSPQTHDDLEQHIKRMSK